jgi:hypothetical protein
MKRFNDGGATITVAKTHLDAYVDRWAKARCEYWYGRCSPDSTPASGVRCVSGQCLIIPTRGCLPPPPMPEPVPEPCW